MTTWNITDYEGRYEGSYEAETATEAIAAHLAALGYGPDHEDFAELAAELAAATDDEAMTARRIDDTWTVSDDAGGRWWPSAEASAQIAASPDPAAEAVRICSDEPMRGEWRS